jgi:hypothetical protein
VGEQYHALNRYRMAFSLPSGGKAVTGGRCCRQVGSWRLAVVVLVRCRCCTLLLHSLPAPQAVALTSLTLDANYWQRRLRNAMGVPSKRSGREMRSNRVASAQGSTLFPIVLVEALQRSTKAS